MQTLRLTKFPIDTAKILQWTFAGDRCVYAEDCECDGNFGWLRFRFGYLRPGGFCRGDSFTIADLTEWQVVATCVALRNDCAVVWQPHFPPIYVHEFGITRRVDLVYGLKNLVPILHSSRVAWAAVEMGDGLVLFDRDFVRITSAFLPWKDDYDVKGCRYALSWETCGDGGISFVVCLGCGEEDTVVESIAWTKYSSWFETLTRWTEFSPVRESVFSGMPRCPRLCCVAPKHKNTVTAWDSNTCEFRQPSKPLLFVEAAWEEEEGIPSPGANVRCFAVCRVSNKRPRWGNLKFLDVYYADQVLPDVIWVVRKKSIVKIEFGAPMDTLLELAATRYAETCYSCIDNPLWKRAFASAIKRLAKSTQQSLVSVRTQLSVDP
jgi:hypothetical protein